MSGNREGGLKAAKANKDKYGDNFYSEIGKIGGAVKTKKGFAVRTDLAKEAGAKGGRASVRTFTTKDKVKHGLAMKRYWRARKENEV